MNNAHAHVEDRLDDDEIDEIERLPEFGIMTYVIGSLMGIALLMSVYVLVTRRSFSLKCEGIPAIFDLTFWKRFFILSASSLLLYFQTDAVTLSLFLAILYTTIFHDLFFRDCAFVEVQRKKEVRDKMTEQERLLAERFDTPQKQPTTRAKSPPQAPVEETQEKQSWGAWAFSYLVPIPDDADYNAK
jgi:hypothetical protein